MKEIQAGRADFLIPGTKTYVHIIVDHWLSKQVDENTLRSLTAFDEEAREVVSRVSPSLSFIWLYICRTKTSTSIKGSCGDEMDLMGEKSGKISPSVVWASPAMLLPNSTSE